MRPMNASYAAKTGKKMKRSRTIFVCFSFWAKPHDHFLVDSQPFFCSFASPQPPPRRKCVCRRAWRLLRRLKWLIPIIHYDGVGGTLLQVSRPPSFRRRRCECDPRKRVRGPTSRRFQRWSRGRCGGSAEATIQRWAWPGRRAQRRP